MAIHDAAYATPPRTWRQYRLRLQHLAEERIGKRVRSGPDEDAQFSAAMKAAQA